MRAAILLALALAAGCLSPQPGEGVAPPPATPFAVTGHDCALAVGEVPIAFENVRHHVPSAYQVVGAEAGRAVLRITVWDCAHMQGPGGSAPAFQSEAMVAVAAVDDVPGRHHYLLWAVTDHADWAGRLEALGVHGGFAPSPVVVEDLREAGGLWVGSTQTGITWARGDYRLEVRPLGPQQLPVGGQEVLWHDTAQGTLRIVQEVQAATGAGGTATVDSAAGDMHTALGAPVALGTGSFARTGFLGTVERV